MFFICLSFIALYGSALNKSGNITPHSRPRCSLRHLGMGLGGETFCSSPMGKIEHVADPSLLRVPQFSNQGTVHTSKIILGMKPEFPSEAGPEMCCMLRALSVLIIGRCDTYLHLHVASSPQRCLGNILCGETTLLHSRNCYLDWFLTGISIFLPPLMLVSCIVRFFIACMTYSNKMRWKYRKTASAIWTRRRVYWRKRQLSRSEYLIEMKSKRIIPTGVAISFANIPNPVLSQRTRNDNVQGEAMNRRPLEKKKSCGRENNAESSLKYCRRKKSFTSRKIGIRSSDDCRRAPFKHVPYFDTPKRRKKRIGFRRRCGNAFNLKVPSINDAHLKNRTVRNVPRRQKKVRRALSPKVPKPRSTPEVKHSSVPNYHISYKQVLAVH